MALEMMVQAKLETGLSFDVETGSGFHIVLDTSPSNDEQARGPSPMEMLLVGLAGCSGMDIISILRKKRQDVTAYEMSIHGKRAETHPQVFVEITVEHILTGHNIQPEAVQRAIDLTEERYCGVSATLSRTAKMHMTFRIVET
jgi:putative redox protein